uniref:Uncharacterized protein AlNc14C295G10296 n=1 Tax=Albugo laibachii Nc14 TaxID=890382 RepID=F0WVF4_9STRA|nr:conserved hypothetical protein [Albugo laibachii Nc14]CCA25468.1 conserved hypothetical protein [Albugo laibachii Nc14]|eukprot:CCA25468.1 conserved hypothetical protein [Albugo laibachii Nc14]
MTTKADAGSYLETLEAYAIRTKKLQTYNTTLGYWSFLLSIFLAFSLPSPLQVLAGQWSLSVLACISALTGHIILLVAISSCIRCCLVHAEEFWDKYAMYRKLQGPGILSEPLSNAYDKLLNLKGPSSYQQAKLRKREQERQSEQQQSILNLRRSFFDRETNDDVQSCLKSLDSATETQSSDIGSVFATSYTPETFGVYGNAVAVPRLYQASDYDPRYKNRKMFQDKESDALHTNSDPQIAWKLLENWGLDMFMHLYCRNVRRLLAFHLKDVMEAFLDNVHELNTCGIMNDVLLRRTPSQAILCPPGNSRQLTNVTLAEMVQHFAKHPYFYSSKRAVYLLDEHMSFEKYLKVGDPSSTAYASLDRQQYVLERLILLSKDRNLNRYRWNSGFSWKGKQWTESLPSDTEILMNVFCCMLDNLLPADNERDRSFWKSYFLNKGLWVPLSSRFRNRICLVQTVSNPPHFKVMAKGTVYEVVPGEENCFHAIIVFLHTVKKMKAGYLESINLHRVLDHVFQVSK